MEINEMIKKWRILLATQNGQEGLKIFGKATNKQVEMLKAAKPEIITELKRREVEENIRKEAEKQAHLQKLEDIKNGKQKIELLWYDGEYLTGWVVCGEEREVLEELGLAEYVEGWGYYVKIEIVEALGEEFTYAEAVEYVKPANEKKAAEKAAAKAEREAKFAEARETGKPVELRRTTDACDGTVCECSLDIVTEYAMPDGTVDVRRIHTY